MLKRIYVDNFRCFVNFEHEFGAKNLIIGRNGSGKSSFVDALLFVRQFTNNQPKLESFNPLSNRTRWMNQETQTIEVDAELDGGIYRYRLVLDPHGDPPRARVSSETVHLNGMPIFEFLIGEVHLFNDRFEHKVTYPFDWYGSALATIVPRAENTKLTRFREWLGRLFCFRLNPYAMPARAEREDLFPNVDLSNIAAWYRHLLQDNPRSNAALLKSLGSALEGFSFLQLTPYGENVRLLLCEFSDGGNNKFLFNELSDGQRCLICLYLISHFLVGRGHTVLLDEPDNFVSLPELQPWLNLTSELVEDSGGQVLIISHHPELINQWAPSFGIQFSRDGSGPVRVERFPFLGDSKLTPAEIVARGWEK